MLSYREGIPRTIWNLGADIEAKLLSLSPEEQTKLSWAKTIKSFDQVPAVYKDSFEALVGNAASFLYTVESLRNYGEAAAANR